MNSATLLNVFFNCVLYTATILLVFFCALVCELNSYEFHENQDADYQFATMEFSKWQGYILKKFNGITRDTIPSVIIFDTRSEDSYRVPVDPKFSTELLLSILEKVSSGAIMIDDGQGGVLGRIRSLSKTTIQTIGHAVSALQAEYPVVVQATILSCLIAIIAFLQTVLWRDGRRSRLHRRYSRR